MSFSKALDGPLDFEHTITREEWLRRQKSDESDVHFVERQQNKRTGDAA